MSKVCLLVMCVLTMCGTVCASDISLQGSTAETGTGVFNITFGGLEGTEGVGFRLSYDPDYLEIAEVVNSSGDAASYVNWRANDGNLSVAVVYPAAVTQTSEELLVSIAYATGSSEPRSVPMTLHNSEYSAGYLNRKFTHENGGILFFRKTVIDTVKDGSWSARIPAQFEYEVAPDAKIKAPSISCGRETVFLDNVAVKKYVGGSWADVPPSAVSVVEEGNVTISEDLSDVAKLDLTFTGRVLGDANNNGITNSADARGIAKHVAELVTLDKKSAIYGDVNRDGAVNSTDARDVARYAVGMLDEHFQQKS